MKFTTTLFALLVCSTAQAENHKKYLGSGNIVNAYVEDIANLSKLYKSKIETDNKEEALEVACTRKYAINELKEYLLKHPTDSDINHNKVREIDKAQKIDENYVMQELDLIGIPLGVACNI